MVDARALQKRIDTALSALGEQLESGQSEQMRNYLAAMGRFHRYSLGNIMLIMAMRPGASKVAGYQTWRKLGRQVIKGEKGIPILAPMVYRKEKEEEEKVVGFRTAYVFDIAQTEGDALPEPARAKGDADVWLDRLKTYVALQGIQLQNLKILSGAEGASTGGTILVRPGLEAAEEFSVLVHELAHERLHHGQEVPDSRTVRETEAEAVAFIVGNAIGLEMSTASSDYIGLYQGNKETLAASLERIQRTASGIIQGLENAPVVVTVEQQKGVIETTCREAA